jgi:hydroxycarboxylate dehydrogenase B
MSAFELTAEDDIVMAAPELEGLVRRIFQTLGSDAREAGLIAEHMVAANLAGHDSHGVSLIPLYCRMVREGKVRPNTRVSVVLDHGAIVSLEGHRGFGQATADEAMTIAVERTAKHGLSVVALRPSHHVGRIGHWAERCAAAGHVSIHFVNVIHAPPVVAPFAGRDARLHTNPIALGIPRGNKDPVILDFATSRVAQGKMRVLMARGGAAPDGYLIDSSGNPTNDPSVVFRPPLGALLPFGDHKGSGLGLLADILAGSLSGGGTFHHANAVDGVYVNNMISFVLNPALLGNETEREEQIEAVVNHFVASPPRDPAAPVLIPGQPEARKRKHRLAAGIPIDRMTWNEIAMAARAAGLAL